MKPKFFSAFALGTIFLSGMAHAQLKWDANNTGPLQTDGAGDWLGTNQWWDGLHNVDWTSGQNATFGFGGAGGNVTLASPTTVGSINFDYFTGTYTLGSAGQALTINGGITKNAGSGVVAFAGPLVLGAAQSWTNNSTSAIQVSGVQTLNNGGFDLTFGGTGNFLLAPSGGNSLTISGSGGIIKNGTGQLNLDANPAINHTFTGDIVVNGGSIGFQTAGVFTGKNTTLNGGYLGGRFNSSVTWTDGLGTGANQIQITGGVSGFSGESNSSSTFTIGSVLSTLKWGATGVNGATGFFNPTALFLNGAERMNSNGTGILNNSIDLNGSDRTFTSNHTNWNGANNTGGVINGALTNTAGTAAGIIRTGVGNLSLLAANTYDGSTTINGGTLTLRSAGTINSTSALNLSGGGILRLVNTAQVDRFADGVAITSNGGGITYENTSGTNVYTETVGSLGLVSGQTNLLLTNNQIGTGSQTLTINTGGITRTGASNTSTITFSAGGTGPNSTKNRIFVTGAGTTAANEIIGSWATTGTAANAQTDYAVYNSSFVNAANIAASAQSTWTTTTASTSNYTMSALASGTISGGTKNINTVRSTNNAVTVTASNANIALAGHSLAVGDIVTFSATTMPTGLTAGTPYYVVNSGAGTIQVSLTSGGAAITPTTTGNTVAAAGGILLSSGNNLGTTGILNGSATTLNILATGTGAITLPTTAAGSLYINAGSGGITSFAPINNNTGALTLVKNGSGTLVLNGANTYTGDTAINAGTLQIGTNNTANGANLNGGSYNGTIFIADGATLNVQTNVTQTLSGVISGDGSLVKSSNNTLILSGDNTYTGKTFLTPVNTGGGATSSGILSVSSFNSVVGGTASSSLGAPTTVANGTIEFGTGSVQQGGTLLYTGSGETTDRIINFSFNGNGATKTIDTSGSGLLKFTSAFTANATATNDITLTGSSDGELVGGLAFAFRNFTKSGAGTWTLGGAVGHSGTTTISGGTLELNGSGNFRGGSYGGTIAFSNASVLNYNSTTNQSLNGAISGSGRLIKDNTSILTLTATNTYNGTTNVDGGTLIVNGSISTSILTTVAANATIGGSGTVGALTIQTDGTVAPGNSPGILIVNGAYTQMGLYEAEIEGTTPGNMAGNHDQIVVNGTVDITGGSLDTIFSTFTPVAGDLIFILLNDGTDAITGTFTGFAQGAVVDTYNGFDWIISYDADSGTNTFTGEPNGNDIALQAVAAATGVIPEPSTALLGALGALLLFRRRR